MTINSVSQDTPVEREMNEALDYLDNIQEVLLALRVEGQMS